MAALTHAAIAEAAFSPAPKAARPGHEEAADQTAMPTPAQRTLKTVATPADGAAASALRTVLTEREGLTALAAALDNGLAAPFAAAVELIRNGAGRVIVSGLGKSGLVARKIAATLASTGTPAFFVHPAEASHGDLGMITRGRRRHRPVLVGRDGGTPEHRRVFPPLQDRPHRHDRGG